MNSLGKYVGAVLPGNPRVDKIGALCVVVEYSLGVLELPEDFTVEVFRSNQEPSEDQKAQWEQRDLFPIDVGANKYHTRKLGSAAEVVATDLGVNLKSNPDIAWLIDVLNRNNKTGYLKGFAHSHNMPYVLAELYKSGMFTGPTLIYEAAAHVIFTHLKYRRLRGAKTTRPYREMTNYPELVELRKQVNFQPGEGQEFAPPFTFAQYMFEMFVMGEEILEIKRRVRFWISAFNRTKTMNDKAIERVQTMEKLEFAVCGHKCYSVRTDDDRNARALFTLDAPPALILVKRSNGSFQLLANRVFKGFNEFRESMTRLRDLVQAEEKSGAKWWLDDRGLDENGRPAGIWALMNGSRSLSESKPSQFRTEALIERIKKAVRLPQIVLKSRNGNSQAGAWIKTPTPVKATSTLGDIARIIEVPAEKPCDEKPEAIPADASEPETVPEVSPALPAETNDDADAEETETPSSTSTDLMAGVAAAHGKLFS